MEWEPPKHWRTRLAKAVKVAIESHEAAGILCKSWRTEQPSLSATEKRYHWPPASLQYLAAKRCKDADTCGDEVIEAMAAEAFDEWIAHRVTGYINVRDLLGCLKASEQGFCRVMQALQPSPSLHWQLGMFCGCFAPLGKYLYLPNAATNPQTASTP